ncbi:MAG: tape measure protein [Acidobacteria bacterium]|nr:tape measure protein [Acidobacteriota bacterium]MCA1620710.1 tape measure protein [Acidobacteriota bacterium]
MAVKVEAFRLSGRVEVDNRRAHASMKESERDAKAVAASFKGLKGEVGSLSNSLSSSGGLIPGLSHISQIIQGIPQIGQLAGALLSPFKDLAEQGIQFNMLIEEAQVGFEGVTGGAQQAAKYVKELTDFAAANPIFNTQGTVRAAQTMAVFGFETRKTTDYLKAWGSALAVGGRFSDENLYEVARAFGQMRAKGKVSAEEMEQVAERGVPAWQMLAKAIGKTEAETRKLSETGRLKGKEAVDAITAMLSTDPQYAGAADKYAKILKGRLAQAQDLREVAAGQAMSGTTKELTRTLEAAMMGDIPTLVNKMAGGMDAALTPVSQLISASVRGVLGGGITSGLAEGIELGRGLVTKTVGDFALDAVISPFKKMLGINSPSKVFAELGGNAVDGFAFGSGGKGGLASEESKQKLRRALEELANDPRVKAWFEVIRQVEGGRPDVMAGGARVKSGPRHPGQIVPRSEWYRGQKGPSSAAGNWQITLTNWRKWAPILGLDNWSDPNQQMMVALALFAEGGGDVSLLKGDMRGALKASAPWAATPLSHLPGHKPLNSQKFVERYQGLVNGGASPATDAAPVPVRVVGTVGASAGPARSDFGLQESGPLSTVRASREQPIEQTYGPIVTEAPLVDLPRAATAAGFGMRLLEEQTKATTKVMGETVVNWSKLVMGSADRLSQYMGAFGQVAGMVPGQQVGKKRGFFSKMLGFAAPFLNFIPGVGPILSQIASIGSSAIGGDYAGAIMGAAGGFSSGGAFRRRGSSPSSAASSPGVSVGAGLEPRATGGPVRKGRTYIVGEHRAEVFEPDQDGFIHPSTGAFERSRGGGTQGGGAARAGSFAAMIQRLIDRIESVPPDHVLTVGSRSAQGQKAIAQGWRGGVSRDPGAVEFMQRRMQTA